MNKFKQFVIFSLMIWFTQASFAQAGFSKKELVNIGGHKISVAEFMKVYNKNKGQDSISVKDYLDLYINFKLKVMEAEALKMDTARSFVRELQGYRKQLAKPYFVDEKITDALVKEAYQRKLYDIRASHILIRLNPDAVPSDTLKAWNKISKIRKEILQGKDFAEAAVTYSEDPSAQDRKAIPGKQNARKGNHGDLGYFSVFNMVYPFENSAYQTAVGEVSPIVRTRFGYHLIKVTDKRPAMGVARVAHIFVRLLPDASPADTTHKWEKINNIYAKIKAGMPFEEAAQKYSEDKGSSNKGGTLPKFTSNRIVPEFIQHIDALNPGEVSKPFRTNYGYHIIKLLSIKHPGSFEQEEQGLRDRMQRSERAKKSKEAVLAQIKKEHHLKINQPAVDNLFAAIDSSLLKGTFVADSLKNMQQPVMWIGKKHFKTPYTQAMLALYIQQHQHQRKGLTKEQFLQKLLKDFIDKKCLEFENRHLEDFYPDFKDLMKEYHDGILLFNLMDKKVWSKAIEDSTGLKSFYKSNAQKYQWKKRVEAEIFETQKQWKDQLIKMVEAAPNKKALARDIFTKKIDSIPVLKADTGLFQKEDNKVLDKIEWKKGLAKPVVSEVENKVTLVYIEKIVPPKPKTFDEARGIVTAQYQDYLEKQWVEALKKKYPVKVNQKVLNKLIHKTSS